MQPQIKSTYARCKIIIEEMLPFFISWPDIAETTTTSTARRFSNRTLQVRKSGTCVNRVVGSDAAFLNYLGTLGVGNIEDLIQKPKKIREKNC